jgi:hypothetical protein
MTALWVAGLDIGSRMTKGLLLDASGAVLARTSFPTGVDLAAPWRARREFRASAPVTSRPPATGASRRGCAISPSRT